MESGFQRRLDDLGRYQSSRGFWMRNAQNQLSDACSRHLPGGDSDEIVRKLMLEVHLRVRSPLEEIIGSNLVVGIIRRGLMPWDPRASETYPKTMLKFERLRGVGIVDLRTNAVLEYRSKVFDFVLRGPGQPAVVECDSAGWHWGYQLSVDRMKDEQARSHGFEVFRFKSDEIFRDGPTCAERVLDVVIPKKSHGETP